MITNLPHLSSCICHYHEYITLHSLQPWSMHHTKIVVDYRCSSRTLFKKLKKLISKFFKIWSQQVTPICPWYLSNFNCHSDCVSITWLTLKAFFLPLWSVIYSCWNKGCSSHFLSRINCLKYFLKPENSALQTHLAVLKLNLSCVALSPKNVILSNWSSWHSKTQALLSAPFFFRLWARVVPLLLYRHYADWH